MAPKRDCESTVTTPEGFWIEQAPPSGPLTFDDIAPPTWRQRLCSAVAALGRCLLPRLPRPAASAAPDDGPAQPGPVGGGATQLPAADVAASQDGGPRICYVRPDEIIDVWHLLAPHLQALRPRQNVAGLVKAAAAGHLALWVVFDPDTEGFAGAIIVGEVAGTVTVLAATDNFCTRWPTFTPLAVVCETYRTPCRRVAPGLLSETALQAHGLHTLT